MHQPGNWTAGRLVNGPINKEAQDGYRHWPWKPQGRCAQTFTAANQNDGTEALDQAQPSKRRIHVTKEARHQEIQRRPARAGLTRQLSDGKELSSRRKYGHSAVAEDDAEPAGDYATREGALEAIYLATSNDIKKGRGVTIRIDPPRPMHPPQGENRTVITAVAFAS
jgi:hypothetical protein